MDPAVLLGTIAFVAAGILLLIGLVKLGGLVFRFWNWVDNELRRKQH